MCRSNFFQINHFLLGFFPHWGILKIRYISKKEPFFLCIATMQEKGVVCGKGFIISLIGREKSDDKFCEAARLRGRTLTSSGKKCIASTQTSTAAASKELRTKIGAKLLNRKTFSRK